MSSTTAVLEQLADRVESGRDAATALTELGKQLHRLRGTAGTFGFAAAAALAEDMEDEVRRWQTAVPDHDAGQRSARVRRFIREFRGACGSM